VLFDNQYLQIGLKSQYTKGAGRVMLYYGNVTPMPLTQFRAVVASVDFVRTDAQPVKDRIEPKEQLAQMFQFISMKPYHDSLTLSIEFVANGAPVRFSLALPIVPSKFTEPRSISAAEYIHRWKQITDADQSYCAVFASNKTIDVAFVTNVLKLGIHLQVLSGVDPNPANIIAAGTFFADQNKRELHVYARLETNVDAGVFRLSARADDRLLTASFASSIVQALGKFSTLQVQK
jgi:AP-2 complex subunit alpha